MNKECSRVSIIWCSHLSGTKSGTAEEDRIKRLPTLVREDREEDRRPCRQDNCHGELSVTDDDVVLCEICRCDVDGVFHWPVSRAEDDGSRERERYEGTGRVRLAGGHEAVYDDTHPAGDGASYEFDISTEY